MSRIKLTLPQKFFPKTFIIPVRITDINYGNHTGNDSIVSIIQEARMQWLNQWGYTELKLEGVGLIMADLAIEFNNESIYGDVIEVSIAVDNISRVSFEMYYKLTAQRDKEVLIAKAKTGMVCFDYERKKVTPLPERFAGVISAKL